MMLISPKWLNEEIFYENGKIIVVSSQKLSSIYFHYVIKMLFMKLKNLTMSNKKNERTWP